MAIVYCTLPYTRKTTTHFTLSYTHIIIIHSTLSYTHTEPLHTEHYHIHTEPLETSRGGVYVCLNTHTSIHTSIHTHNIKMHDNTLGIHACTCYTYMYVCIYKHIDKYIHIKIYDKNVYVCIYIHTHKHRDKYTYRNT